jgi:hypothetical protein
MRHPRLLATLIRIKRLEKQDLVRLLLVLVIPLMVRTGSDTEFHARLFRCGIGHLDKIAFGYGGCDSKGISFNFFNGTPDLLRALVGELR